MTDQPDTQELLNSVVAVARAIFGAAASAMFLHDKQSGDLVFRAVSGVGEDFLVGNMFPADVGIVGWVISSAEPIIVDELAMSPSCVREIAHVTGYRPSALMAAPLLTGGEVLGLLVVLDPVVQSRSNLTDLELLSLFAGQAAVAVRVVSAYQTGPAAGPDAKVRLLDEFRDFLLRSAG